MTSRPNSGRNSRRSGLALMLLSVASISSVADTAQAGDFVDTWLTFAFEDPHVLASPEDGYARPGFYTDERAQTFFDNYDTMYSGRETKSQLVLYKRMPRIMPSFDAEWSLVSRYTLYHNTETGKPATKWKDDGSFIRLMWTPEGARRNRTSEGLSLTVFPFDSERFKLGYSYDLTWGGKRTFVGNLDEVPGLKLEYNLIRGDWLKGNAFAGAKSARLLDESINEQQTYFGFLGGAGVDLFNAVKLDLQGGLFEKAAFPPKGQTGPDGVDLLAGRSIWAYGVSARAGVHSGTPIGKSADFRLYRQDPYSLIQDLRPEQYDARLSASLEGEFSYLGQTLIDFEELGTTVIQPAVAGDVNLRLKYNRFRGNFNVVYRSLSFILFNVPGMSPYYDFPEDSLHTDETYVAMGIDYHLPKQRLTPGLVFGYQVPSTYMGVLPELSGACEGGAGTDGVGCGTTTIVVRDEGNFELLPPGEKKYDILTAKTTLRWELGDSLNFLSELSYSLDKNQTKYDKNTSGSGTSIRIFDDWRVFNKISYSLFLQARF